MFKKTLAALALGTALLSAGQAMAADYKVDKEGQHAFINFKISHLGYSFIYGTFKDWDGTFSFDAAKPEDSKISISLKTASVFTNQAERDKHISSADFLDVAKYPEAKFVSTSVKTTGKDADGKVTADVTGDLTLHGVTKSVVVKATFLGEGKDPWGGYRAGFAGTTTINRSDFGKMMNLGPASESMELIISFEGIQAK
ncbi:YceI family protein [Pseudomonas sp. CCI3.2]|uniref:YceI family protein n=1 Tax=unclassified Pseudomonas TaxID=196821 RepID=UPI002AC901FF|nr:MULTISPECIES: YceI family protein [unclassified Pseudomonas]MEB0076798.1 YceI family protein [Pseudomonas sp. MH10out]MEB0092577.1 YceI family protein [Pseudomonas sp. CCI4.2]MEB0103461.1 YceI family protein [Pseudomonas sp. CCI3.2]MEB0119175.1 YceI family protein [Pseudomonas sp. CCI1.2]MEB0129765.1 YceI family protein [Pseudomonas sp. CCI2.4]